MSHDRYVPHSKPYTTTKSPLVNPGELLDHEAPQTSPTDARVTPFNRQFAPHLPPFSQFHKDPPGKKPYH